LRQKNNGSISHSGEHTAWHKQLLYEG